MPMAGAALIALIVIYEIQKPKKLGRSIVLALFFIYMYHLATSFETLGL
jgi:hypothetical protein